MPVISLCPYEIHREHSLLPAPLIYHNVNTIISCLSFRHVSNCMCKPAVYRNLKGKWVISDLWHTLTTYKYTGWPRAPPFRSFVTSLSPTRNFSETKFICNLPVKLHLNQLKFLHLCTFNNYYPHNFFWKKEAVSNSTAITTVAIASFLLIYINRHSCQHFLSPGRTREQPLIAPNKTICHLRLH